MQHDEKIESKAPLIDGNRFGTRSKEDYIENGITLRACFAEDYVFPREEKIVPEIVLKKTSFSQQST